MNKEQLFKIIKCLGVYNDEECSETLEDINFSNLDETINFVNEITTNNSDDIISQLLVCIVFGICNGKEENE